MAGGRPKTNLLFSSVTAIANVLEKWGMFQNGWNFFFSPSNRRGENCK
ncbi:MAG: hypothetical protein LBR79_07425 [Oscillospiraceae bacterium]|nr:hypothetical protein [Oscillospiraceae bacterium]